MSDASGLVELSHGELVTALVIFLRSNTAAIPIMRGKGSTRDTNIRSYTTTGDTTHAWSKKLESA